MSRHVILSLCTLSMVFFSHCSQKQGTDTGEADFPVLQVSADSMIYYSQTIYKSIDSCLINDPTCTYIRLMYPIIEDGPTPMKDTLSHKILRLLQFSENRNEDPGAIAEDFLDGYKVYRDKISKEAEYTPAPWYMKKHIHVTYSSKNYFGLALDEESYTGGAHGMYSTIYHNYDLQSGKVLHLKDIVIPEMLDSLTRIGERLFRLTKNITEGKSLNAAGYFVFARHDSLVGRFYLNDNFSMGANGIIFHYNPYEIAPYVNGSSKIIIPYSRLKDIALPGSLLEERIVRQ